MSIFWDVLYKRMKLERIVSQCTRFSSKTLNLIWSSISGLVPDSLQTAAAGTMQKCYKFRLFIAKNAYNSIIRQTKHCTIYTQARGGTGSHIQVSACPRQITTAA